MKFSNPFVPKKPTIGEVLKADYTATEFALLQAQAELERALANVEMYTKRLARLTDQLYPKNDRTPGGPL